MALNFRNTAELNFARCQRRHAEATSTAIGLRIAVSKFLQFVSCKICNFLAGSFSAVSKRFFASDLHNYASFFSMLFFSFISQFRFQKKNVCTRSGSSLFCLDGRRSARPRAILSKRQKKISSMGWNIWLKNVCSTDILFLTHLLPKNVSTNFGLSFESLRL